jgi:hypothetical protein
MLADGYDAETVVSVLLAQADAVSLKWMAEAWLRTEVDRQKRNVVRDAERKTFTERRQQRAQATKAAVEKIAAPIVAAVRFTNEFLALEFSLPGGRSVTWGDATAEDHAERCEMLQQKVDGLSETMGQHQEVLDLLRTAGAKCLNDLKQVP